MTQIVDKRLSKMCNKCQSMSDKPCAWLSLGNEYCDEIMEIQQEIERLKEDVELFKSDLISCTNTGLSLITRIDKAIEYNKEIVDNYLEEDDCEYCDGRYATAKHNLNILQNGDDSQ